MANVQNKWSIIKILVMVFGILITISGWAFGLGMWKASTNFTADDVQEHTERIENIENVIPQVEKNTSEIEMVKSNQNKWIDDISEMKGDIKEIKAHLEWLREKG